MESSSDTAKSADGGSTPDSSDSPTRGGRWSTATRCYLMAIVWGFVGLAITYLSYNDRMVVLEDGAITVFRNEQGMVAGYVTMGFAVAWLLAGFVLSVRNSGDASA